MSASTFEQVAGAVSKICKVVTRGGKYVHRFSVVSVSKGAPTAEAKIILNRTGLDLTVPGNLAAVVLAAKGDLYTDGISVWDRTAEAERTRKAQEYRDSATAIRQEYRAAITEAVEDTLAL
jgi:hypothetical protein